MSAEMTADNPYNAPEAELGGGSDELYSPKIISFNGRLGRLRYLAYGIGASLLMMLAMMVMVPVMGLGAFMGGEAAASATGTIVFIVLYIPMIIVMVMFGKRRLNDLNRSGWWMLLNFVPLVNVLLAIYLLFFPGTDGNNDFGPPAQANSTGVLILAWMFPVFFILGMVAAIAIPQFAGVPQ